MRILAINGSPNGAQGNTECLLRPFLEGAREAGAQTETIYLKDKKINHCIGCFSCWSATPGKCVLKDDMQELLGTVLEADMMVYATPLYYYTVTGLMKDFIDRKLPMNNPEIVETDSGYQHSRRYERKSQVKTVLISNCGFPGAYNFSGLVETFKVMTGGKLDGAVLCTEGGILRQSGNPGLDGLLDSYFKAVRKAGKEMVEQGLITSETQEILDKPILDPKLYLAAANKSWGVGA
jgi:Multimeric flavodoxin WrbA